MKEISLKIKIQRIVLVVILMAISFLCFDIMNQKYDRLARYEYVNDENRIVIEENLDDSEIDFLIQQKVKPEQFLPYIHIEGFDVKNTLYYDACQTYRPTDLQYIVDFSNRYREVIKYADFIDYIINYDYVTIAEFYNNAYTYVSNAVLIPTPNTLRDVIKEDETLYKYVPTDLVALTNDVVPSVSNETNQAILVKQDLIEPLTLLLDDMEEHFKQTDGGLIATQGYVSYDAQIKIYEQKLIEYGVDSFQRYDDFPGQSINQLGYTITFTIAGIEEDTILENEQVKWLAENAEKYGFTLPYGEKTGDDKNKEVKPLTLTYVGIQEKQDEISD